MVVVVGGRVSGWSKKLQRVVWKWGSDPGLEGQQGEGHGG